MTDYTKITNYAAKDLLLHLDPAKAIKGTEIGAEFDYIATMSATKTDKTTLAASGGSALVGYLPYGTGAVATTVQEKLRESVSVLDFGADPTGGVDSSQAINNALATGAKVIFPYGTYLITTGVSRAANNINIDFGSATLVNGNTSMMFSFGVASTTTSTYTGLTLTGGTFTQSNPAAATNNIYIGVLGIANFSITKMDMRNVGNGGIYVAGGAIDGEISDIRITSILTGGGTVRGIWLDGSGAVDYASQFVDTTSMTRNTTPAPLYGVKNIIIKDCYINIASLGIYLMNAWDITIQDNYINTQNSGLRCITANTYSPRVKVMGNRVVSAGAATGLMITQWSYDCTVIDNTFTGNYGGGYAIHLQYLSNAYIKNNMFRIDSGTTQIVQIDSGAYAVIKGNDFTKSAYAHDEIGIRVYCLDPLGITGTVGNTATTTGPGTIIESNTFRLVAVPVQIEVVAAANGTNFPAPDTTMVWNNFFGNFDLATNFNEVAVNLIAPGATYPITTSFRNNVMYPVENAVRNNVSASSGTGYVLKERQAKFSLFVVSWTASATPNAPATCTRSSGEPFVLAVVRNGSQNALILQGRLATSGISIPISVFPTSVIGNPFTSTSVLTTSASGNDWIVYPKDSAGVAIDLTNVSFSFYVMLTAEVI